MVKKTLSEKAKETMWLLDNDFDWFHLFNGVRFN